MKIIASRTVTTGGVTLSGGTTWNKSFLTSIEADDSYQVEGDSNGALINVPPGEYDVEAEAVFYANGKTGLVRARVVVDGDNIVRGLSGYIEGFGTFTSIARGRIKVRPGQTVSLELNAAAAETMDGWASDGAAHTFSRLTLTRR